MHNMKYFYCVCTHSNGHAGALIFSVHPVIKELTMHSGALSDNGRWKMSNLGETMESRRHLLDIRVDTLSFVRAIKATEPYAGPNIIIMWWNIRNILFMTDQNITSLTSSCNSQWSWLAQNQNHNTFTDPANRDICVSQQPKDSPI